MVEQQTVEVERVEEVQGWPLSVVRGSAQPLIEDEELGRRLGYERARAVRDLIERLFNDSDLRRTVRQSGGRPATVYLLTRTQAIKVAMRSETEAADRIQDEIIAVYERWLDARRIAVDPGLLAVLQGQQRIAEQLTVGVVDAKASASRAEETARKASADAAEAKRIAEQARTMAGARGVLETLAAATPPGRASSTPDGAFSRKPKDGYKSMRAVARDYSLPRVNEGALLVAKVAEALGVFERPELFDVQEVVIGGRSKGEHRTYAPAALELIDQPLRAAYAVMVGLGYVVTAGGALRAIRTSVRSKSWVVAQMFDAAIATSAPPPEGEQQALGFEPKKAS
jgi:hypothetical protein